MNKFSFPTGAAGELKGQALVDEGNKKRKSYENDDDYTLSNAKGKQQEPKKAKKGKPTKTGGQTSAGGRRGRGRGRRPPLTELAVNQVWVKMCSNVQLVRANSGSRLSTTAGKKIF